jgi:hypothetical protein
LHTVEYDLIYVLINGDTTVANYNYARLQGEGNTSTTTTGQTGVFIRTSGSNASAANFFGTAEITIYNYSGNTVKSFSVDSANEFNATTNAILALFDGVYSGSAPVTSLTFYPNNATIATNTTVTLYGIKNAAKTAGNSIKATGGNIVFDGTYVYHVFPSTGAFVPTVGLTADVLAVAGGGGGANYAGAGAGGVFYQPLNTLSVGSSYIITVGAGGAGVTGGAVGNSGSYSQFGALTQALGGGYGGQQSYQSVGGNGGSGGGSGPSYSGFSYSSGQIGVGGSSTQTSTGGTGYGNAGAAGNAYTTSASGVSGGGGGGAGGAGGAGIVNLGGSGGVGTNAFSQWCTATGAGVNGYIAGGGAGYSNGGTQGTGGTGGGGNGGVGGTANTGGGGGGVGGGSGVGYNGGSGIIIVRYKG